METRTWLATDHTTRFVLEESGRLLLQRQRPTEDHRGRLDFEWRTLAIFRPVQICLEGTDE
jgi:hypothetical protein